MPVAIRIAGIRNLSAPDDYEKPKKAKELLKVGTSGMAYSRRTNIRYPMPQNASLKKPQSFLRVSFRPRMNAIRNSCTKMARPRTTNIMKPRASRNINAAIAKTIKSAMTVRSVFSMLVDECFSMAPNNQDKGPTRRMTIRMNLIFPRRSP